MILQVQVALQTHEKTTPKMEVHDPMMPQT
jgi:hypothetical protein